MAVIISARIVSTDPPVVSDGYKIFEISGLPIDSKTGNWCKCELNDGFCNYIEPDTSSFKDFPGFEWKRLQFPLSDGRTRIEALRFRSLVMAETRRYFTSRGFWEVETPLVVPSPGVETHLNALTAGKNHFLSPSPEFQMKRLLAGGSGSIFQITKCFRDDETGRYHNPEFTMIEWYNVGADANGLMNDVEGLITHLVSNLGVDSGLRVPPYPRITMAQAFKKWAGIDNYRSAPEELFEKSGVESPGPDCSWEEAFFKVFVELVEPRLTEDGPCFLTKWPAEFASLSRLSPEDNQTAERFEFFANNLEIANGFHELTDYNSQRNRSLSELEERKRDNKPLYPLDEKFLNSLAEAMPDTAGIALGMDRLVMLLWGAKEISEVLTFTADEL